jgi:hypothetical protein
MPRGRLVAFTLPLALLAARGGAIVAAQKATPDLGAIVSLASTYVVNYNVKLSAVVAEETYEQNVLPRARGLAAARKGRKLRSDFLLVRLPGAEDWMPFRDVFEVDGEPVRDRDDRLRKLFLEMPADARDVLQRILDEGSRYNVGSLVRNVNQPMLALKFLTPGHLDDLSLSLKGVEEVEGLKARRLDFRETGSPTVVRDLVTNRDVPSTGSFWIDEETGRVVKSVLRSSYEVFSMETSVVFRPIEGDPDGLWAPAEMRESYVTPDERIFGVATYANFRRFQVKTETIIK